MAVSLAGGVAVVALLIRASTRMSRRKTSPPPEAGAKGEYQPLEPPEGRYWG